MVSDVFIVISPSFFFMANFLPSWENGNWDFCTYFTLSISKGIPPPGSAGTHLLIAFFMKEMET